MKLCLQVYTSIANSKIQKKGYNSVSIRRPYSTYWIRLIKTTNKQLSLIKMPSNLSPLRKKPNQNSFLIKAQYEQSIPNKPISYTSYYFKNKSTVMPLPERLDVEQKDKFEVTILYRVM
jgi:hypothetical protein